MDKTETSQRRRHSALGLGDGDIASGGLRRPSGVMTGEMALGRKSKTATSNHMVGPQEAGSLNWVRCPGIRKPEEPGNWVLGKRNSGNSPKKKHVEVMKPTTLMRS